MQRKGFLYFLTDDAGRCYKIDARGMVIVDATIKPLEYTPDGWQDKTLTWSRDDTYRGMLRQFSLPMKFVNDGAKIVRYLFYVVGGVQASCFLRIAKLNPSTGIHEAYYSGALDFSTFSDDKTGMFAQISVLDSGLASLINNKQGTTYNIPIGPDDDDPLPTGEDPRVRVQLDGINLIGTMTYTTIEDVPHQASWHFPDAVYVTEEGHQTGVTHQNVEFAGADITDPVNDPATKICNSSNWILKVDQDITFTITLDYSIDMQNAESPTPNVSAAEMYLASSASSAIVAVTEHMPATFGWTNYSGSRTVQVSLLAGQTLLLYTAVNQSGILTGNVRINYKQLDLSISGVTREITSFCYALRLSFVFERLIHKIAAGAVSSSLLTNNDQVANYTVLVTNGNAIRRLDAPIIKTTFQDFFKALNCIWNIGLDVENETAILENIAYFYQPDVQLELGEVSNLKIDPDTDHLWNLIQVGYPAQTYDDVNGKDEFNNTSEFSTPLTRINQTLDLVSPYRADMYGIEFARINFDDEDTTDGTDDETIFFLVVENKVYTDDEGDYYKLYRAPGATVSGLLSGSTAFNIELSPKHNLLRHGNYIHSSLDKQDTQKLVFQSTDKNDTLSITYPKPPLVIGGTAVTIAESTDESIGTLTPKIYLPYVFTFDTEIPDIAKKMLDANPRGLISFSWLGNTYTGFVVECAIKPAFREAQTWKVLAGPANDLSNLRNG